MPRVLAVVLCLAGMIGATHAATYDDFSAGIAARNRGDSKLAIEAFSRALSAPDLAPALQPVAYLDRATAYLDTGHCSEALADLSAALDRKPNYVEAIAARVYANECTGAFEAAIDDATHLIAVRPAPDAYAFRGLAQWVLGRYAAAASDFREAAKQEPDSAYDVLWLALSDAKAGKGTADALADTGSLEGWPAPAVALFRGRSTPEALIAAAADTPGPDAEPRTCEAKFYAAEWHLLQGDGMAAKPLLREAAEGCPRFVIETQAAAAELKRLATAP